MQAGKLRHRLTIQKRSQQQNGYGEESQAWADEATVWGSIRPLGVIEQVQAQKTVGNVSHIVEFRAPQIDPSPEKRIIFGERVFEVIGQMDWDERNIRVRVMCKEIA